MPSYSPQDVQDELLKVIRTSQETVVEAVKTWVDTVKAVTPKVSSVQLPLAEKLPKAQDIVTKIIEEILENAKTVTIDKDKRG